jgi:hypothetical protein
MIVGVIYKPYLDQVNASIDFASLVSGGETLVLVSVTSVNVKTGADSTAALIATNPAPALNGTVVSFQLIDGQKGEHHLVTAKITIDGAETNGQLDVFVVPNPIDLTTRAEVKSWLGIAQENTADDDLISGCITAASAYWLWRTARGSATDEIPDASPLVEPVTYDEVYDGSGSARQFLRNNPIVSVLTLEVNGRLVPASTGFGQGGYTIDGNGKSLVLRGEIFKEGIQNVHVVYQAGFRGVPADIRLAATQMVAVNYKRRQWIDQKSQAMAAGAGTVTYRDWELPPEVERVISNYSRTAVV